MYSIIISQGEEDDFGAELAGLCGKLADVRVLLTPHLYHLPDESRCWAELGASGGTLVVVSPLHPRPARWLLHRHGIAVDERHVFTSQAFDCARDCFAAICDALGLASETATAVQSNVFDEPVSPRWYPVLDKSRCSNCGHCRQFCLFGVYELNEDGEVVVQYPDRCKPGCPACSRICPHGAIIFPLYAKNAAIAGAPGLVMSPDQAARRMYYLRTKLPCPLCGQHDNPRGEGPVCEECGRPLYAQAEERTENGAAFAEIDALIDAVDEIARRK